MTRQSRGYNFLSNFAAAGIHTRRGERKSCRVVSSYEGDQNHFIVPHSESAVRHEALGFDKSCSGALCFMMKVIRDIEVAMSLQRLKEVTADLN